MPNGHARGHASSGHRDAHAVEDLSIRFCAAKHPKQLKLHNILGQSAGDPAPEGWTGEVGWIDEEKIKRLCPPPAADTLVFVCGVPALYTALCGPRGDKSLPEDTVLAKLGYTPEMVSKF